jgi:Spy/CpxP family protein refolding chaperone
VATPGRPQSAPIASPFFTFARIGGNLGGLASFSTRRAAPSIKEIVMTNIDNIPLQPEPPIQAPRKARASAWPRVTLLAGAVACGVALGVGGLAIAANGQNDTGWREGGRLAFIQHAVAHALDSVGANADQEAKVHDIVAAKFAEFAPKPGDREAMRKQALDLLGAPTIDRAAVERLRTQAVADFDAKSKALEAGLLDIADQLTPAQRAKLATELADMRGHGPMMGWEHGQHHRHNMDGGPDGQPDSGPDKE